MHKYAWNSQKFELIILKPFWVIFDVDSDGLVQIRKFKLLKFHRNPVRIGPMKLKTPWLAIFDSHISGSKVRKWFKRVTWNSIFFRLFLSENASETLRWTFYRSSIGVLSSRAFLKMSLLADFWQYFKNGSKTHPFILKPWISVL